MPNRQNKRRFRPCWIQYMQLSAYPDSSQQADIVGQHLLENEEITGCLLLMQLLHLVLYLCQLGQSPGQGRVVLRVSQHGQTFGKYCRVPTQFWFATEKESRMRPVSWLVATKVAEA